MKATMNFELTNLLKEKGMIIPYAEFYDESSPEKNIVFYEKLTIAEVVMWLYDKYMIWIRR